MIFELCSNSFNRNVIIKPIDWSECDQSFDAWEIQDMLMKAFPNDCFYIACYDGYENAVEFVPKGW